MGCVRRASGEVRTNDAAGVPTPVKLLRATCLALAFAGLPSVGEPARSADLARVEKLVFESTNRFRGEQGVAPVAADAKLHAAARDFAQFMARSGRYAHDADGRQPSDRARAHGYDYCVISENIAYQFDSRGFGTGGLADLLFEGWKRSAGHRRNLLDAEVTDSAVAVARSAATGYFYAVQMFARPRSGCRQRRG